jgi:hypothetical protein
VGCELEGADRAERAGASRPARVLPAYLVLIFTGAGPGWLVTVMGVPGCHGSRQSEQQYLTPGCPDRAVDAADRHVAGALISVISDVEARSEPPIRRVTVHLIPTTAPRPHSVRLLTPLAQRCGPVSWIQP